MNPATVEKTEKETYEKPRLRVVDLASEEVLAKGCKMESDGQNVLSNISCTERTCVNADS